MSCWLYIAPAIYWITMSTSKLIAKLACITDVLKTECIFFFLPPNYLYLTQNKMSWLSKKIFVCFS